MATYLDQQVEARRFAKLLVDLDRRLSALERTTQAAYTGIQGGALDIYDEDGELRGSIGVQPDGAVAVVPVNTPPPPTPTAPTVTAALAGLTVAWDGQWEDSYTTPSDFALVQIHLGDTDDFEPGPGTLAATLTNPAGDALTLALDSYTPAWVRLVAATTAALTGPPSPPAPGTPRRAVSQDLLEGVVGELQLADDAVTAAKVAVDAIGTDAIAPDTIQAHHLVAGAVQTGALAADSVAAGKIAADAVTARELAALSVTADKLAANSVTAGKIEAGAITAHALAADAITGKTIDGSTITGSTVSSVTEDGATVRLADGQFTLSDSSSAVLSRISPDGYHLLDGTGRLRTTVGPAVGPYTEPGIVSYGPPDDNDPCYSVLSDGSLRFSPVEPPEGAQIYDQAGLLFGTTAGGGRYELMLRSGSYPTHGGAQINLYSALGDDTGTEINLGADHTHIGGLLTAGSIATGRVGITPTPGKPTPLTITGLSVRGNHFHGFATLDTTVVGTTVHGVAVTDVTSHGLTVWVNRSNAIRTYVNWMVIGS